MTLTDDSLTIGLDAKNGDGRTCMDVMSNEHSLTGMLEAADMKRIDMIYPLLGALMDRVSSENKTCPMTTIFTGYVDIMRGVCGITKRNIWTEEELQVLSERIKMFKTISISTFDTYKKSSMCTV